MAEKEPRQSELRVYAPFAASQEIKCLSFSPSINLANTVILIFADLDTKAKRVSDYSEFAQLRGSGAGGGHSGVPCVACELVCPGPTF